MKHNASPFKWRHDPPERILLCVRRDCRYQLSYRDLEGMMREPGLDADHSTVSRWVQRYAPETNKRIRPHLRMSGASFRVAETYIEVGKSRKDLYRAVDKEGQTTEFMLSAQRDVSAAKRFFKKLVRADHRRPPSSISADKNAAYPGAFSTSQAARVVPPGCKLRRVKYLNNVIAQDHRVIEKKARAAQRFKRFHTAERTVEGIESLNMLRAGQVRRLAGGDAQGQAKFVESLVGSAA